MNAYKCLEMSRNVSRNVYVVVYKCLNQVCALGRVYVGAMAIYVVVYESLRHVRCLEESMLV
jgi:hypothetical protein